MNDITAYTSTQFGSIRTLTIDDTPWFVGKDVATALGYSNTQKAIRDHVDEEDKLTERIVLSGQNRNVVVINESGLYSLIFSSTLPSAKAFKHWVTSEVLPSIRKNGGYGAPVATPGMLATLERTLKECGNIIMNKLYEHDVQFRILANQVIDSTPVSFEECLPNHSIRTIGNTNIRDHCIQLVNKIAELGGYTKEQIGSIYSKIYTIMNHRYDIDIFNKYRELNYSKPFYFVMDHDIYAYGFKTIAEEIIETMQHNLSIYYISSFDQAILEVNRIAAEKYNSNSLLLYRKIYKSMNQSYNIDWTCYTQKTSKIELIKTNDVLQQAFISCVNDLINQ